MHTQRISRYNSSLPGGESTLCFRFLAATCSAVCSRLSTAFSECAELGLVSFLLLFSCFCVLCFRRFFPPLFLRLSTVRVANDSLSENGLNFHHRTVPSTSGTSVALTLLVSRNISEMLLLVLSVYIYSHKM